MPAKKLKQKNTPQKKKAELDLLHDPVLRSGIVATLALFTLLLLIPLSPCKSVADTTSWGICGQAGWDSLAPGYELADRSVFWFGGVDLTGPARGFVFAGLFGVLYLLYLKVYICCLTKCKCFCC